MSKAALHLAKKALSDVIQLKAVKTQNGGDLTTERKKNISDRAKVKGQVGENRVQQMTKESMKKQWQYQH